MWWPPHYWRKDYHQFNGAKILLSHTHEGIASSRANDDPPLFSLDNRKLVPHGIEPLTSHSAIQSFCQLNEPRMWPDFIEPPTWRYVLLWWPSFVFPRQWTTSPSRDWTLNLQSKAFVNWMSKTAASVLL